jgi:hypothetical protein
MSVARERRHRLTMSPKDTRSFPLWFGVLAPPLAWAAHLLLSDGVFELGCAPGFRRPEIYGLSLKFWQLLETGLAAAVTILAGVLAWRAFKSLRSEPDSTAVGRARTMAIAGMGSAFIYLLPLVFGFLPAAFLRTCGSSI